MITNKDIRVENGFLIINGDKFPLDGQSPEAIIAIIEAACDTTPTENSDAPITSGGVFTALGTKEDTLTFDPVPTENSTNPVTSGGIYTALAGKQDSITNLAYITTGLTPNANCSIKAGGYIQIGKLIIVNIRVLVTATGAEISGLPIPAISDQNNCVGGVGYNTADGSTGCFYINNANGSLIIANNVSSGDILISLVYAAN